MSEQNIGESGADQFADGQAGAPAARPVGRHADPTQPTGSRRAAVTVAAVGLVVAYIAVGGLIAVWMHATMGWGWPHALGFAASWMLMFVLIRMGQRWWRARHEHRGGESAA